MTHTEELLKLLQSEEAISPLMCVIINDRARVFLDALKPAAERFLRNELDFDKYAVDEVRTLIQSVPGALLIRNNDGMYPIQSITWDYSDDGFNSKAIPFLPLLAEEGSKLNVGGVGMRGGLLIKPRNDVESESILEELVSIHQCEGNYSVESKRNKIDRICLNVIKDLRKKNLFWKDDIKRCNLLVKAHHPSSIERFSYLLEWCPEACNQLMQSEMDRTSPLMPLMHDGRSEHESSNLRRY